MIDLIKTYNLRMNLGLSLLYLSDLLLLLLIDYFLLRLELISVALFIVGLNYIVLGLGDFLSTVTDEF